MTKKTDFEQAAYFLNILLPDETGNEVQYAGVPLRRSDEFHKQLIELYEADPSAAAEKIRKKVTFNFRSATPRAKTAPRLALDD